MVETPDGMDRHAATPDGWEIEAARRNGAARRVPPRRGGRREPLIDPDRPLRAEGTAALTSDRRRRSTARSTASTPPSALTLDYEDQYRRSEEPYAGPEEFSATLLANWDDAGLYFGVDVVKAETIVRPDDAPPLRLDNEPDDIHADGVQMYLRPGAGRSGLRFPRGTRR